MGHWFLDKKIYVFSLSLLLLSQGTIAAAKRVTVIKAIPASSVVQLKLVADVSNASDSKLTSLTGRNYRLSVQIPKGPVFDVAVGSSVAVTLPTIHHRDVQAKVSLISKSKIELVLFNQVQILDGQRLQVTIPVKPIHLYSLPFQAIYSPRGITTEVFTVTSEQRVNLVSIVPLHVLPNGRIIVSSEQLKDATIVVQGTDNLVAGDSVQIIEQKEMPL